MMKLSKPFRPPFVGLAAIVWLYAVACSLLYPGSYVLRGAFIESDNYTYLAQVLDWLQGQGWYDNVQHRLAPPQGTFIHYTRLAELPMAAFTLLFHALNLPWTGAATLGAMIYPPLLLFGLFAAARWTAESFVPPAWSRASAYLILFSQSLLFQFSPGHVGHRAPAAILILLVVGCVNRMMLESVRIRWSVWAGFLLALALAMALESLPWALVIAAWVGVWLLIEGRSAARSGAVFGAAFFIASALLLALYRPPSDWFAPEIASYSIVYVILTGGIALCYLGVACVAHSTWRYAVGGVLAVGFGAVFLHQFPELAAGPYGGMDKNLADMFFASIDEARPLLAVVVPWVAALSMAITLLALTASGFFLVRARAGDRWLWGMSFLLLASAIALTLFYQSRFFRYANLFSLAPLTVMLERGWLWIDAQRNMRAKPFAKIALVLLAGPLLTVVIPAMLDGRPFVTGVLMFPARDVRSACDLYPVEGLLQSPDYFGKKPLLIMNTMSTGPEILFRTHHSVMGAPYHYNARGNLDAVDFFGARDWGDAKAIAERDRIDMVLICKSAKDIYRNVTPARPRLAHSDGPDLIEQLLAQQVPPWLQEVNLPPSVNFLIFTMRRD